MKKKEIYKELVKIIKEVAAVSDDFESIGLDISNNEHYYGLCRTLEELEYDLRDSQYHGKVSTEYFNDLWLNDMSLDEFKEKYYGRTYKKS